MHAHTQPCVLMHVCLHMCIKVTHTHTWHMTQTLMCTHTQDPRPQGWRLGGREGVAPPAPTKCCMCRWPSAPALVNQRQICDKSAEQQSARILATWGSGDPIR